MPVLSKHAESKDEGLKTTEVVEGDAAFLRTLLRGELQRSRALVEIANLRRKAGDRADAPRKVAASRPLLEKLGQYPAEGVDLDNIVTYPPRLEPVPVKPLFLDVAWNYVRYPTTTTTVGKASVPQGKAGAKTEGGEQQQQQTPAKKGWFGFGRG